MASSKQTKTKKKVYTCPLCDNVLDVDSTFVETRCENCGMYVVNTDQELNEYQIIADAKAELHKNATIIGIANELINNEKYVEAKETILPLLKEEPTNPAVCYVYVKSIVNLFAQNFSQDKKSYLSQEEIDEIELYSKPIKQFLDNNPTHEMSEQFRTLLIKTGRILQASSLVYASASATYNWAILEGEQPPKTDSIIKTDSHVKIEKEKKTKTSTKIIKKSSYKDYLDDPEPIPFPGKSGIKWLTITFWVLGVLSLLSLALIFGIWVARSILSSWNLDFSKYNFRDLLVPSGLGAMIIAVWLSWFIYWIVRKFKKINSDEPKTLMWARQIATFAFILSAVYLVWKIIAVAVCNTFGTSVDTGMTLATEKQSLYNTIFVMFGLIALIVIFNTVNRQRFYDDMNNKPFTFVSFIRYVTLALTFIALALLIIFGISAIVHLISNDIVKMIFGTEAELVKQIVKYGLIVSASTLVLGIIIDVIWTSIEKKKNEKEVAKNLEEIKQRKAKNAGNIKIIYMSDIPSVARAKVNLKAKMKQIEKEFAEINQLADGAFLDMDYKTYEEIDHEMHIAITGKPFNPIKVDKEK